MTDAPMTDETCDCCQSPLMEALYKAPDTVRGLTVYGCQACGLLQSLPRIDKAPRRAMAVSAGADWGNVRYGKAFRTNDNIDLLKQHIDPSVLETILDVGANRGAFCAAIKLLAPKAQITALEPDERVIDDYRDVPRVTLLQQRIEDASFQDEAFDLIYSCHTLEHLKSPQTTLQDHWRVLKPGGHLLLELPNIHMLGVEDMVEEFFIDKHLYHYDPGLMVDQLEALGFDIIAWPDPADVLNITILAQKNQQADRNLEEVAGRFEEAQKLIEIYRGNLRRNQSALHGVARRIENLATSSGQGPLAIWGGGRLFNSLVEHGALDVKRIAAVADTHLARLTDNVRGAKLIAPDALPAIAPGIIIVMSRVFYDEIAEQARDLVPGARLIGYAELMADERLALKSAAS